MHGFPFAFAGSRPGRLSGASRRAARALAIAALASLTVAAHRPSLGLARADALSSSQRATCGALGKPPCSVNGRYRSLSAGYAHTCAIAADGALLCWGDGRSGALGDSQRAIRRAPAPVATRLAFAEVRAGGDFTCARTSGGDVYCWGKGPAVPGGAAGTAVPLRVEGIQNATALTAGRRHACAITAAKTVVCWGRNIEGQGGNGTSGVGASVVAAPTPIASDLQFFAVAAGFDFTCALTLDGEPWCWGSNVDGVLGGASPEHCGDVAPVPCSSRPVRLGTTQKFVELSTGGTHACALDENGAVFCWGSNVQGQLGSTGQGREGKIFAPRRIPEIPGMTAFSTVAAGSVHTCALAEGGALFCLGSDPSTQPGVTRNPDERVMFARRFSDLSFVALSAGGAHTCGISTRAQIFCWGDNQLGALGPG